MKYYVNENCIGCGLCNVICPQVFEMTPDNVAKAVDKDVDLGEAQEAKDSCPVGAIEEV